MGERFPNVFFTSGSSWSDEFAALINRKLLGFKVKISLKCFKCALCCLPPQIRTELQLFRH